MLENACKWARQRVDVKLAFRPDGALEIVVEDDGPGLAADVRQRVFDPGVRLDGRQEGQGPGLAIVRDIAESCGIGIRLAVGRVGGLRVTLSFPAARVRRHRRAGR